MNAPMHPQTDLPEALPRGERILWRGRPDPVALAFAAFRIGWVAAYFGLLFAWRFASSLADGAGAVDALVYALWILPLAAAGLLIIGVLAWLAARTTIYTVTDRRVVMRIGIALPLTLNLPYAEVEGASVKERGRGTGDIAFALQRSARIGYAVLWPHARAGHFARPQPTLRAIPDIATVAERVAGALAAAPALAPHSAPVAVPMADRRHRDMPAAYGAAAE